MRAWLSLLLVACAEHGARPVGAELPPADPVPGPLRTSPMFGGTLIAVDADTVLATDPRADRVIVARGLAYVPTVDVIDLAPGATPWRSVLDDTGRVHVSLRSGGVATVDLDTRSVVRTREVCPAPRGIDHDPVHDTLIVVCASGELVWLDPFTLDVERSLWLAPDLRDVVVEPDTLWVSRFRSAEVLELAPDGTVRAVHRPPDVTAPSLADPSVPNRQVAHVAWRMRAHPAGGVVLLHQRHVVDLLPEELGTEGQPVYYGELSDVASCSAVVRSAFTWFQADADARTSPALATPPTAVDFAVDPASDQIYVANGGARPDLRAWQGSVMAYPISALWTRSTCMFGQAVELARARDAAAVAVVGGRVISQSHPELHLTTAVSDTAAVDAVNDQEEAAFELFHGDHGRGVSCAGCHPEGQDDGHVWSFDAGPRRTQNLAAGTRGTAPYHWTGEHADLSALLAQVLFERMGASFTLEADIAALEEWLGGLDPVRVTPSGDDAAIARGTSLFHGRAACGTCHQGDTTTDNRTVDVGTGAAFQVPSLRGIGYRAPYMHDGCAETLVDRFTVCGGGIEHGAVDGLDGDDIADLVAYLETL